jgi:hypothetical protein
MHLHGSTFDRYVTRELSPAELTVLDNHVGNCLPCAQSIAGEGLEHGRWERRGLLGRLVRVGPDAGDR